MLKEIADLLVNLFPTLCRFARGGSGGTPTTEFRFCRSQLFPNLGYRTQHCFGQFLDDVKLAKLMRHIAENLANWLWIQVRTVGGDPFQFQVAFLQHRAKCAKETLHVGMSRVVIEYLVADAPESVVIDD